MIILSDIAIDERTTTFTHGCAGARGVPISLVNIIVVDFEHLCFVFLEEFFTGLNFFAFTSCYYSPEKSHDCFAEFHASPANRYGFRLGIDHFLLSLKIIPYLFEVLRTKTLG